MEQKKYSILLGGLTLQETIVLQMHPTSFIGTIMVMACTHQRILECRLKYLSAVLQ